MIRNILTPIIIILLLFIIFTSIQTPDLFYDQKKKTHGEYNFENVTISLLKSGKKEWELTAKQSTIFNNSKSFFLVDVKGKYFGANQNQSFLFDSPTGAYYTDEGILRLVKTSSKLSFDDISYFIRSDELELNSTKKMLYAYGNLNINSDNLILTGQKMIGNFNKNKIYLSYDIEGSIITNTPN